MSKFLKPSGLLLLIGLCANITYAQDIEKIQLSAGTGYQRENFHWSIAGNINGQNPNIYSELKWKAISGSLVGLELHWNIWKGFLFWGDYSRSFTTTGTSNDIDYQGNNRTNPIYNQNFNSNKGCTAAWSAGVGYMVFKNKTLSISPYIGYGINYQSYYLLGSNGNFSNLNTSYKTQWRGPFLELSSALQIINRLKVAAYISYSQVNYSATADWNLIETFQHPVSFRDSANGYGVDAGAKLIFSINHHFSINIGGAYFKWETGTGTDQLYLVTGQTDKTQLNGAVRNGFRLESGLSFAF
jgi:hypothetical protein